MVAYITDSAQKGKQVEKTRDRRWALLAILFTVLVFANYGREFVQQKIEEYKKAHTPVLRFDCWAIGDEVQLCLMTYTDVPEYIPPGEPTYTEIYDQKPPEKNNAVYVHTQKPCGEVHTNVYFRDVMNGGKNWNYTFIGSCRSTLGEKFIVLGGGVMRFNPSEETMALIDANAWGLSDDELPQTPPPGITCTTARVDECAECIYHDE